MQTIKNLKVLTAGLCLGATLLTGCENDTTDTITLGADDDNRYKVTYEDDKIIATIPLSKIENSIRILDLESKNRRYYQLAGKYSNSSYTCYYNLKTGEQIAFRDEDNNPIILEGEYSIISYLESTNNMWLLFDVNDLISFYDEQVFPNLENKGSEKVYEKEN